MGKILHMCNKSISMWSKFYRRKRSKQKKKKKWWGCYFIRFNQVTCFYFPQKSSNVNKKINFNLYNLHIVWYIDQHVREVNTHLQYDTFSLDLICIVHNTNLSYESRISNRSLCIYIYLNLLIIFLIKNDLKRKKKKRN